MAYYPVYLNLKGRSVLLVGGGAVSLQKLRPLVRCGAKVHLVSPDALPAVRRLARDGKIKWSRRAFRHPDLKGVSLVIAATDDPALQKKIASLARVRGLWVNVVDVPGLCDFIAPAVVRRGDIQMAISTGGAAPALAKYLRRKAEKLLGSEYADFARFVRTVRPAILKLSKERRRSFWECVVSDAFFAQIKRHGIAKAGAKMKEWIHA